MQIDIFGSFFGKVKDQYRESAREVKLAEKGNQIASGKIYDNAQWHYKIGFLKKISKEQGATHIGFFLRWCFEYQLVSASLQERHAEFCKRIKGENCSYPAFVIQEMQGIFSKTDLNYDGQSFADAYYTDRKTNFSSCYGSYIENYAELVSTLYRLNGREYYCVKDIEKNYEQVKAMLDQRYKEFQMMKYSEDED